MSTEALKQALEALKPFRKMYLEVANQHKGSITRENVHCQISVSDLRKCLYASCDLEEAIEEEEKQEQEPVGYWMGEFSKEGSATLYQFKQESVFGRVYRNIPVYNHQQSTQAQLSEPAALALREVVKATLKFPTWPNDPLHALAVLGEEFGELTKDVLQLTYEPHKTNLDNVRTEAIQTAAMALRFLASVDAYKFGRSEQHEQPPFNSTQEVGEQS